MTTLLKIDPYLETIYSVDVADTLTDVCRQIGARRLTVAGQQPVISYIPQLVDCPDAAYCDEEAIHVEPLPPAFRLRSSGHVIYGCALWHRVTEEGHLQPPAWTLKQLTVQVEFLGFRPVDPQADLTPLDDESLPLDEPDTE